MALSIPKFLITNPIKLIIQTTSCRPQRFLLLLLAVMIINKRVVVHLAPALQRLCLHCHFLLCRSQNLFPVVEGEWRPSPTLLSDPLFVPTDKTFQRVAAAAAAAPDRRLILQLAPNPLLQGALQQHRMPDLPTAMIALVTLFLSLSFDSSTRLPTDTNTRSRPQNLIII